MFGRKKPPEDWRAKFDKGYVEDWPVNVRISKPSNQSVRAEQPDCEIEIEDKVSGATVARITLPFVDMARLVMHNGGVDCEAFLRLDRVGTIREVKHEDVRWVRPKGLPYKDSPEIRALVKESRDAAVAEFEVDGWSAHTHDLGNRHNSVSGEPDTYRTSFTRFVPADSY